MEGATGGEATDNRCVISIHFTYSWTGHPFPASTLGTPLAHAHLPPLERIGVLAVDLDECLDRFITPPPKGATLSGISDLGVSKERADFLGTLFE